MLSGNKFKYFTLSVAIFARSRAEVSRSRLITVFTARLWAFVARDALERCNERGFGK